MCYPCLLISTPIWCCGAGCPQYGKKLLKTKVPLQEHCPAPSWAAATNAWSQLSWQDRCHPRHALVRCHEGHVVRFPAGTKHQHHPNHYVKKDCQENERNVSDFSSKLPLVPSYQGQIGPQMKPSVILSQRVSTATELLLCGKHFQWAVCNKTTPGAPESDSYNGLC